jgi:hypothetical protein
MKKEAISGWMQLLAASDNMSAKSLFKMSFAGRFHSKTSFFG